MEAVAYFAHEEHSDMPKCVSLVLSVYGQKLNDLAPTDADRQSLRAYVLKVIGTAGDPALDGERALIAVDYAVRVFAPMALRAANLHEQAKVLASLPTTTWDNLAIAQSAASAAAAASDAASDAASAARRSATYAASAAYVVYAVSAAESAAESAASAARPSATNTAQTWPKMRECFERMIWPAPQHKETPK